MNSNWNKFKLLMWKNWILIKRSPIQTVFEILIPLILCGLIVVIRNNTDYPDLEEYMYSPHSSHLFTHDKNLTYSPCNHHIQTMLEDALDSDIHIHDNYVICFPNAKVLDDHLKNNADKYYAGVVFEDKYIDNRTLDGKILVQLRLKTDFMSMDWNTNKMHPDVQTPTPQTFSTVYDEFFVDFQVSMTKSLLKTTTNNNVILFISTNGFPYASYYRSNFYDSFVEVLMTMLFMDSFILQFGNVVNCIATEKENQLKESMKIMGLPEWLNWSAWFLRFFISFLIGIILIMILMKVNFKVGPVFKHSDGSVLFLFFIIYACSVIAFAVFVTVFFSKAIMAAIWGSIIYYISTAPYLLQPANTSFAILLASCLLPNTGLGYALTITMRHEAIGKGIHWNNLFSPFKLDEKLSFGAIILMLLVDIIIYLLIAFYLQSIFPGEFGIPQPWYFPFTSTYWCGNKTVTEPDNDQVVIQLNEFIEETNKKLPTGIQLKNLSKTFGANQAVKQLNLDIYEGQITILLGHNGAGKTTTMSMITGMIPPTSGTAIVGDYDVRTNIQYVRDSMGLCLQHNVLFNKLTVQEHLFFFGKLKGLSSSEIQQESDYYIQLLELEDKRHSLSKNLSGGMKRKLSVAISLCGNSKVVMLDEPTAGMDPSARRTVWELLQQQKKDRTILLTTHFMDEADILGDRIAIMTAGEIQCVGSSFFLKKKYGAGYHLIIDVQPTCNVNDVTTLLRKYISTIKVESHIGSELSYLLLESESKKFEAMLSDLEQNRKQLKINSFGISVTPLEEVFMKVGVDHKSSLSQNLTNGSGLASHKITIIRDKQIILNQIHATLLKKYITTLRSWILILLQICIPVLFLTSKPLCNTIISGAYTATYNPPLKLTLDSYKDPITLLSGDTNNKYYSTYKTLPIKGIVEEVENIENRIIEVSKNDMKTFLLHYIVGASFFDNFNITAWYNAEYYHTAPLAVQLVLNAILAYHKPNTSIEFINYPLPLKSDAKRNNFSDLQISFVQSTFGFCLVFVASFYVLLCIKDRVSKSKHLQYVSGMNVIIYWGSTFLWDMMTYLITALCMLITIIAIQEDGYKSSEELGCLTVLLISFGFSALPFVYLLSYLFSVPATGFIRILFIGLLSTVIAFMVYVLNVQPQYKFLADILNYIFLPMPFYLPTQGISTLREIYLNKRFWCCNYFSFGPFGIGLNVLISFILSIHFFLIIFLIDNNFLRIPSTIKKNKIKPLENLEEDVLEEKTKIKLCIKQKSPEKYALVLDDLTKYYGRFTAVNGLCLGVQPFECFGLLGVNGAGKTTTFKMLTGDETISSGTAWTNGISLNDNLRRVQKLIGYCPQFDALLDHLTSREILKMFALIRGVPYYECKNITESLAHQFDFYSHLNKKIKDLSGGTKRKLSTSIALIGDPEVIYLDEPTTGMDPASKRFIWEALCKIRDSGKTIILTSHSMEECQALCTRLAIMVNGSFQCLGSKQRLKNKFAQGYSLTIKLKKQHDIADLERDIKQIKSFIKNEFPHSTLKDSHQQMLNYILSTTNKTWSQMFGTLEKNKEKLNIEDYSIGQGSLEQVFLNFTQKQN